MRHPILLRPMLVNSKIFSNRDSRANLHVKKLTLDNFYFHQPNIEANGIARTSWLDRLVAEE